MQKKLNADEYYPFFKLYDKESFGIPVEVSAEFFERYNRVMKEFEELQDALETYNEEGAIKEIKDNAN